MNKVKIGSCLLLCTLFLAQPSYAGCKSDCLDEYQSAKEDCINLHDDPDEADDLRMCIDDAKAAYDECVEDCENYVSS
jgi:hypothetical protein